jgi:glycine oxidase
MSSPHHTPDILIAGAGIIGLSLALELHHRGHRVTVLERDTALTHASIAAAGMLAAHDPHNPPALQPLSDLSLTLYPAYLDRMQRLSGLSVPFQTQTTLQHLPNGEILTIPEHSLDPRQLAPALLAAVRSTSIDLREHTPVHVAFETSDSITVTNKSGLNLTAQHLIFTLGSWSGAPAITPRKGQMLRVKLPPSLHDLHEVHRNEHIYIVPRTLGPQAGTALIGATVEDAGFDTTVHPADLSHLRTLAANLLPALADPTLAPQLESWAGLRPATPDYLPLLGRIHSEDRTNPQSRKLLATGHYRNGILLAPATATLLANLLESKPSPVDLTPFNPTRF